MLSYMLPGEDKSHSSRNLNLNLNLNGHTARDRKHDLVETERLLNSVEQNAATGYPATILTANGGGSGGTTVLCGLEPNGNIPDDTFIASTTATATSVADHRKCKTSKFGNNQTKSVTLKRVSFGSSKGSMVETLVFETPTPLPEHAEREFIYKDVDSAASYLRSIGQMTNGSSGGGGCTLLDDSGIEMQEEPERSRVRVSFFNSDQPKQVSPPDFSQHLAFFGDYSGGGNGSLGGASAQQVDAHHLILADQQQSLTAAAATAATGLLQVFNNQANDQKIMASVQAGVLPSSYDRQLSTESGWDNPFRPGGDLSREADEIVNMIKGGKPITPTTDAKQTITNGATNNLKENGSSTTTTAAAAAATVVDGVATKLNAADQLQSAQNGMKSPLKKQQITNNDASKKNGAGGVGGGGGDGATQHGNGNGIDGATPQSQVSNQVLPAPQSASHVVIEDKKKKKCTCCVIQ